MIYEVKPNVVLGACSLHCYAKADKGCQLFVSIDDNCYLGSLENTQSATTVTGTFNAYINYVNVGDHLPTFLGSYGTILDQADGSQLSRTVTSSSTNPENVDQCKAFCSITGNLFSYKNILMNFDYRK